MLELPCSSHHAVREWYAYNNLGQEGRGGEGRGTQHARSVRAAHDVSALQSALFELYYRRCNFSKFVDKTW